jgi:phosphohistidine swiveling domain-containing protein
MYKFISTLDNLKDQPIGPKTLNLIKLKQSGFNVPEFIFSDSKVISNLNSDQYSVLAEEIDRYFKAYPIIIRSSSLNEDSTHSSMAGRFKSQICNNLNEIPNAINLILKDAQTKNSLDSFSLIIQKFIKPDISGISFSRNPKGDRSFIVEYHSGLGEEIVSGKVKPKIIEGYWNSLKIYKFNKWQKLLLEKTLEIEQLFNNPQDIEFVIYQNNLCIVQSRPITTINKKDYFSFKQLDSLLPQDKKFAYKLNDISNTIKSIRGLNEAIIDLIYQDKGPMDRAYKEFGVNYNYTNYLKIIGDKIYTDLELEKKSLYDVSGSSFKIFYVIKNYYKLTFLKANNAKVLKLFKELEVSINENLEEINSLLEWKSKFGQVYKTVCKINILNQKSLSYLKFIAQNNKLNYVTLLNYPDLPELKADTKEYIGNSLDFFDESEFQSANFIQNTKIENLKLNNFPEYKIKFIKKASLVASNLTQLREYSRWVEVKYITKLREILKKVDHGIINSLDSMSWLNLFNGNMNLQDINRLSILKDNEIEYQITDYPEILSSNVKAALSEVRIISEGQAKGVLINFEDLKMRKDDNSYIVYNDTLDIAMAEYLDSIKAIITDKGGELSHLAILARERRIPVVVGVNKKRVEDYIGKEISVSELLVDGIE